MKIIGRTSNGFITEVSAQELKKFYNAYYSKSSTSAPYKIEDLNIGNEIDLGKGHDFLSDTKYALQQTQDFLKANKKVIKAITDGINILNSDIGVIEDEK